MKASVKTSVGKQVNRTGMSASAHAESMREVPSMTHPSSGNGDLHSAHALYLKESHALGSVPPPTTVKGAAKTAVKALKGKKAIALVDRIAERLAFERTGVRLYDALLDKLDSTGSFDGGPEKDQVQRIRDEEHAHARMLAEALEQLGADPTAVTPSADLVAMEGSGLGSVLADPRTNVGQCLHALIIAELADGEGWTLLRSLAGDMGSDDLAERFGEAGREEERHLNEVRSWLTAHARAEAELI